MTEIIVPKKVVEESNDVIGDDENVFKMLLDHAEVYKLAGMTPMFIYDAERNKMGVVAQETYKKKLH